MFIVTETNFDGNKKEYVQITRIIILNKIISKEKRNFNFIDYIELKATRGDYVGLDRGWLGLTPFNTRLKLKNGKFIKFGHFERKHIIKTNFKYVSNEVLKLAKFFNKKVKFNFSDEDKVKEYFKDIINSKWYYKN